MRTSQPKCSVLKSRRQSCNNDPVVFHLSSLSLSPQVPLIIPIVFCLTSFFMVFLSLYSDPVNTGIGFAISLTGIPAYYIFIVFDRRPKWIQKCLGTTVTITFTTTTCTTR